MDAFAEGKPGSHAVDKLEPAKRPSRDAAMEAVRTLIAWAGDDPRREGLIDTPRRVVDAYSEWYEGYVADPALELARVFEDVQGYDDMVMLRDIEFNSHCEHHIAPFIGRVHVAYLPKTAVVGISKLARVVEIYARRLQTQETGTAHFWSRSRNSLWQKGETSGETLQVTEILTDCDQDVLLVKALPQGKGAACHTGRRSCFYRRVERDGLVFVDETRLFDPKDVY